MAAPRRILVGVDGSAHSQNALEWAAGLAGATKGEVLVVHALGLLTHLGSPPVTAPAQGHRQEVQALLEGEWCKSLRTSGVPYRCLLVDGNPTEALMVCADAEGADLVVVGPRGTGGLPGLQLGSTSHQLVQLSKRPVAVVPGN
ncbi:MAG TPA: universal stress protein [Acidimicrobiales bacterium]|nr:universal stress protein [Acidimicrobiales bacterium]